MNRSDAREHAARTFVCIRVHSWLIHFVLVLLLFAGAGVRAERYLTTDQAGKIAFPTADRFEEKVLRFTPEQAVAIEKKSGVPVKVEGNKIIFAYEGARSLGVLFIDHVLG